MNRKVKMLIKENVCSTDNLLVFLRRGEWSQDKNLASMAPLSWAIMTSLYSYGFLILTVR